MRECEQQSAGKIALLEDTGGGRKRDSGGDKRDGEEDQKKRENWAFKKTTQHTNGKNAK